MIHALHALRPVYIGRTTFKRVVGAGVEYYTFGLRNENRSFELRIGRTSYCWEWTRRK